MAEIDVRRSSSVPADLHYLVTVSQGGTSTRHDVTVGPAVRELADRYETPEDFVRACFEFLLARESKESILASFDVSVIGRYFPEFEREIASD